MAVPSVKRWFTPLPVLWEQDLYAYLRRLYRSGEIPTPSEQEKALRLAGRVARHRKTTVAKLLHSILKDLDKEHAERQPSNHMP